MIRPRILEVLGHVVHARIAMEGLKETIVYDMQQGYRPTYRGHEWGREHFANLEVAATCIEAAFQYLKWCQFPEVESRLVDGRALIQGMSWEKPQGGGYLGS